MANLLDHQLASVKDQLGWSEIFSCQLKHDGSDRRYYRISHQTRPTRATLASKVIMQLGDEDKKNLQANRLEWIAIRDYLEQNGFLVPKLLATMPNTGLLVTSDLGDQTLADRIQQSEDPTTDIWHHYSQAIKIIERFLRLIPAPHQLWSSRVFDFDKFRQEITFFSQHFLKHYDLIPNPLEEAQVNREADILCRKAASASSFFTHRDFHSRNLMVTRDGLAIIDFQDARKGPSTYDLISLCFDPYVNITLNQRLALFQHGLTSVLERDSSGAHLWPYVLFQRQLKAIGSYSYLTNIVKRGSYLQYITPALQVLIHYRNRMTELPFLADTLIDRIAKFANTLTANKEWP